MGVALKNIKNNPVDSRVSPLDYSINREDWDKEKGGDFPK